MSAERPTDCEKENETGIPNLEVPRIRYLHRNQLTFRRRLNG